VSAPSRINNEHLEGLSFCPVHFSNAINISHTCLA
jgi:hypothetical protein